MPIAYTVQYSCDGGTSWMPTNCANSERSCRIDMLPAGTACAFRVRSGSTGGWSAPSATAVALTSHSDASIACAQQLINQVNGQYLSPGATVAIVVGMIAVLLLLLCCVWYFMCGGANAFRKAPPPPPPAKFDNAIPPPPPPAGYGYQ